MSEDDITVEDYEHPEVLEEPTPEVVNNIFDQGTSLLTHYGWFILAGVLALFYFRPKIEKALDRYYKQKDEREYAAKCKKDPDWLRERQQAVENARLRMQEELNRKAKEHAEKQKEKEEKKRQELVASTSDVGGNTLGNSSQAKKNSYRPEYHPLMGSGGSGYRPPRRSCCPSGGCG